MIHQSGSGVCALLLYPAADEEPGEADAIATQLERVLPAEVLAVAVEESGAFGIDYWASMLAAGIHKIVVLLETPLLNKELSADEAAAPAQKSIEPEPGAGDAALIRQATLLNRIVAEIGVPGPVIEVVHTISDESELTAEAVLWKETLTHAATHPLGSMSPASFVTHNQKRVTFRTAIDHLLSAVETDTPERLELSADSASPFGQVAVEQSACTLCMACVSTCPAGALLDGQSVPQLRFIEANCLQCGLCVNACPEDALSLQPGFEFDTMRARQAEVLNEEEPFNCISCHTPFATRKMITTMTDKLSEHWMFEKPAALRRLKMCEDCRVKDMFEDNKDGIQVHKAEGETPS